jgi:branched-subunit amino acid transport protein
MTAGATDLWTLAVIAGLAGVTVLTRCFFFILDRAWTLPRWAERALQYAPVAALAGVVLLEVVVAQGALTVPWLDARCYAALAGALLYYLRGSVLLTMLAGMAVYLPLHLGLGW